MTHLHCLSSCNLGTLLQVLQVFLTVAILMGEGMYMVLRVMLSTGRDLTRRWHELQELHDLPRASRLWSRRNSTPVEVAGDPLCAAARDQERAPTAVSLQKNTTQVSALDGCSSPHTAGASQPCDSSNTPLMGRKDPAAGAGCQHHARDPANARDAAIAAGPATGSAADGGDDDKHLLEFKETAAERLLRIRVFLGEAIPWWLAPAGYGGLAVLSTIFIPIIYHPVKWYYVAVAYIVTPLFALPNSYGTGLTDWDNCSMYGKLVLFIFAAWAGSAGKGVIVGLGICGVVFGATSSAATLMSDFRTGYICLAAPRAMFVAQLVGQLIGAALVPIAFLLFYNTGLVNVPDGPYPSPFSTIYRGMALIGTQGFAALPKYCGVLMLAFFLAGMLLCLIRDLLPSKYARFVPSPMAMGIPFYIGAASAIDFWLGSVVVHIWEFVNKASADELAQTVGAGLLVGDGLWSVPSSIIAIAGRLPPVCMGFYGKSLCSLPYCMGFWLGGSERVPA
eukprot:GHRR01013954.1.p1 GENE.GHRR01013954.1~~GHRR01013954.1.p1  ORF type:complete len:506 (+),score=144.44 GHRR01013954.1:739-2256(+)